LDNSIFLPFLNNEKDHPNYDKNRDKFKKINAFMMVEFLKDTEVNPKESA
jgi:hypothetical protein